MSIRPGVDGFGLEWFGLSCGTNGLGLSIGKVCFGLVGRFGEVWTGWVRCVDLGRQGRDWSGPVRHKERVGAVWIVARFGLVRSGLFRSGLSIRNGWVWLGLSPGVGIDRFGMSPGPGGQGTACFVNSERAVMDRLVVVRFVARYVLVRIVARRV